MKKEVFTAVMMVGFVSRALAQGTILFANDNNGLLSGVVWGVQMYEDLVRAPAYVQVFAAPGGTPFHSWSSLGGTPSRSFLAYNPGFMFMGSPTPILPQAPGRFNGGSVTISNIYPGESAEVCIVAWSGNFKSFDEAIKNSSVYVGASGVIHFDRTGDPLSSPIPDVPVPLRLGEGYQEALREPMMPLPPQIPEPKSVVLLMLLGGVIFFRKSAVQRA